MLQNLMEKKRTPYRDRFMEMFGIGNGGLPFIRKESVYNQFYSEFDMEHEELLVLHPQQWAREIKKICL